MATSAHFLIVFDISLQSILPLKFLRKNSSARSFGASLKQPSGVKLFSKKLNVQTFLK